MEHKFGLILEGGAMRGMFSAGVCDVLMENGVRFDGACGVSAGAAFGCNYKSNQIGRVIRYNTKFCRDPRYCSIRSLIRTGDLFGADFCYRKIPQELDVFDSAAYLASPMEFYVVATDVETGKPLYKKCETCTTDKELLWIRASASMPLASRIVEVDGYKLLDGGISDSIPLKFFESIGYSRNVVILTQPTGYEKKKNSAMPIIKLALRRYPNAVAALANRHVMYNDTLSCVSTAENDGRAFVIRPPEKLPIGHIEHDARVLKKVYDIGRATAEENLPALNEFMAGQYRTP